MGDSELLGVPFSGGPYNTLRVQVPNNHILS